MEPLKNLPPQQASLAIVKGDVVVVKYPLPEALLPTTASIYKLAVAPS